MMKKLIIFDLDGTLINTLEDLTNSVNFAISHFDYPKRTLNDIRLAIGNGVSKLVARSIPGKEEDVHYQECLDIFVNYYEEHAQDNTKPYEGLINPLKELKSLGYTLCVCTNKIDNVAKELVNKHFPDIFDYVQGEIPSLRKKPYQDMIDSLLSRFNIKKDEALYIGDTEVDEQTATNSGVDYMLVTYGFRTLEELKEKCPKAIYIDNISKIKSLI